jgi:hypothetical protein
LLNQKILQIICAAEIRFGASANYSEGFLSIHCHMIQLIVLPLQLRERLSLLKTAEEEELEKKRDDILRSKVVS